MERKNRQKDKREAREKRNRRVDYQNKQNTSIKGKNTRRRKGEKLLKMYINSIIY